MILQILFWTSVFLIFHSYVLYPFVLKLLAKGKKENQDVFSSDDDLPFVSILMSVHNEENVIMEKVRSIYYTLYPMNKFELLVGSDHSTDGTNRICKVYEGNYRGFHFYEFNERQGKPAVINSLVAKAKGDILILTDAKVFFEINTIFELVKHFKNKEISIAGGFLTSLQSPKSGIGLQEKAFIDRELTMKYQEGLIWGKTIGIYGAVYAIRKTEYSVVPDNYSVDDFYITMKVLERGGKVILIPSAKTREEVPNESRVEFKRKVRISSGNFQNLRTFIGCIVPPWKALSFAFISHKVIRWIAPFLILLSYGCLIFLYPQNIFYSWLFYFQTLLLIIPFIDFLLRKINIHVVLLRFISHFLIMNVALLVGFGKNILGYKSNIWQPTKR